MISELLGEEKSEHEFPEEIERLQHDVQKLNREMREIAKVNTEGLNRETEVFICGVGQLSELSQSIQQSILLVRSKYPTYKLAIEKLNSDYLKLMPLLGEMEKKSKLYEHILERGLNEFLPRPSLPKEESKKALVDTTTVDKMNIKHHPYAKSAKYLNTNILHEEELVVEGEELFVEIGDLNQSQVFLDNQEELEKVTRNILDLSLCIEEHAVTQSSKIELVSSRSSKAVSLVSKGNHSMTESASKYGFLKAIKLKMAGSVGGIGGVVGGIGGTLVPIPGVGTTIGIAIGSTIGAGVGALAGYKVGTQIKKKEEEILMELEAQEIEHQRERELVEREGPEVLQATYRLIPHVDIHVDEHYFYGNAGILFSPSIYGSRLIANDTISSTGTIAGLKSIIKK